MADFQGASRLLIGVFKISGLLWAEAPHEKPFMKMVRKVQASVVLVVRFVVLPIFVVWGMLMFISEVRFLSHVQINPFPLLALAFCVLPLIWYVVFYHATEEAVALLKAFDGLTLSAEALRRCRRRANAWACLIAVYFVLQLLRGSFVVLMALPSLVFGFVPLSTLALYAHLLATLEEHLRGVAADLDRIPARVPPETLLRGLLDQRLRLFDVVARVNDVFRFLPIVYAYVVCKMRLIPFILFWDPFYWGEVYLLTFFLYCSLLQAFVANRRVAALIHHVQHLYARLPVTKFGLGVGLLSVSTAVVGTKDESRFAMAWSVTARRSENDDIPKPHSSRNETFCVGSLST